MEFEQELCRQRMKTLSQLAKRLEDDCRDALTSIMVNADTLEGRYGKLHADDAVLIACHDDISQAVQRLDQSIGAWFRAFEDDDAPCCELEATLRRVEQLVESQLQPHHRLERHGDVAHCWVALPPTTVVQVLLNLIENAVEAARDPLCIQIDARREGDQVAMAVRDDGPGIATPIVERIFDAGFSTRAGSAGMGLSFAREMTRRHGGELELAAGATGACFELRLPVTEAPTTEHDARRPNDRSCA